MKRTITTRLILIAGGILFLSQLESCKHDSLLPNNVDTPVIIPTTPSTNDGPTLYANICASCHGPLASSAKRGASATLIQTGISTVNNMKSLTYLTLLQIDAIAAALHDSIPAPTPTTLDGTTLYNTICANCHGPLASSTKLGASDTLIRKGISTIPSMQNLTYLSAAQIEAITSILHTTKPNPVPSTDGTALYASYCASCHGPLASSTKLGATASLINTGISTVSQMQSLSTLTSTQIQAIASILQSTTPNPTPSTDGTALYASYCASCHGPLASSTKLGATASLINTGISTVSQMQSLSTLTATQIQAIAGILQSTTPNPTPSTDGPTLYASYCASCHGPLASSAKIGASVSRIQTAISTVSNMSTLSTLSSTQIQAISTALMAQSMPTDGPTLYAINCASCHGALAHSSAGGASVSEIQGAIREKSKMKYLSTLTLAQLQAISGALAGVSGGDH